MTEAGTKVESFLNRQTDRVNIKGKWNHRRKRESGRNKKTLREICYERMEAMKATEK